MNLGFKVAVFMICINIAAGIMNTALPDLDTKIDYDSGVSSIVESTLTNVSVDPAGGSGSNPDSFGDRVLDFMHLGWINKVTEFLFNLLFGFSVFLGKIFGDYYTPYKIYVDLGITTAYGLSIVMIWLGRKLN